MLKHIYTSVVPLSATIVAIGLILTYLHALGFGGSWLVEWTFEQGPILTLTGALSLLIAAMIVLGISARRNRRG